MSSCLKCKHLSQDKSHLNNYLKSLPFQKDFYTCKIHLIKPKLLYFTSTWLFGLFVKSNCVCAGENFEHREKVIQLKFEYY